MDIYIYVYIYIYGYMILYIFRCITVYEHVQNTQATIVIVNCIIYIVEVDVASISISDSSHGLPWTMIQSNCWKRNEGTDQEVISCVWSNSHALIVFRLQQPRCRHSHPVSDIFLSE